MPETPLVHWRAIRDHVLRWKAWDEREMLVYHPGSGQTHRLSLTAAVALERLEQGPLDPPRLARYVAQFLAKPCNAALRQQIDQMLIEFDRLGLIEQVRS